MILGVAIGIVVIRFAATIFTRLIAWEPALEHAAYLLLLAIGGELIAANVFDSELSDPMKFVISLVILALTVIGARLYAWGGAGRVPEAERDLG